MQRHVPQHCPHHCHINVNTAVWAKIVKKEKKIIFQYFALFNRTKLPQMC